MFIVYRLRLITVLLFERRNFNTSFFDPIEGGDYISELIFYFNNLLLKHFLRCVYFILFYTWFI